jgi:hypothetical protein
MHSILRDLVAMSAPSTITLKLILCMVLVSVQVERNRQGQGKREAGVCRRHGSEPSHT